MQKQSNVAHVTPILPTFQELAERAERLRNDPIADAEAVDALDLLAVESLRRFTVLQANGQPGFDMPLPDIAYENPRRVMAQRGRKAMVNVWHIIALAFNPIGTESGISWTSGGPHSRGGTVRFAPARWRQRAEAYAAVLRKLDELERGPETADAPKTISNREAARLYADLTDTKPDPSRIGKLRKKGKLAVEADGRTTEAAVARYAQQVRKNRTVPALLQGVAEWLETCPDCGKRTHKLIGTAKVCRECFLAPYLKDGE